MVEATSTASGVLPDGGRLLPVLAPRQLETLKYIYEHAVKTRDYPTGAEIGQALGVSKQAVSSMLTTLVKKGYAYRDRNISERNIRLTEVAFERMQRDAGTSGELFPRVSNPA